MTAPILDLDALTLDRGKHNNPSEGACVMEVVSMLAKEPFTDRPACVSTYLTQFGITLNDRASDKQRQDLKQFIPLLPGTAGDGLDDARRWLATDHVTRVSLPWWMDAAGLADLATELRGLREITDRVSYNAARPLVTRARDAAYQKRSAALGGKTLYGYVYDRVKAAVSEELRAKPAAAAAAADAAAATATTDTAAAATDAAAATAAAAADTAAAATAAAATAAAATAAAIPKYGTDAYWAWRGALYEAVYAKVRAVYEERLPDLFAESWADGVALFGRLINPAVTS